MPIKSCGSRRARKLESLELLEKLESLDVLAQLRSPSHFVASENGSVTPNV